MIAIVTYCMEHVATKPLHASCVLGEEGSLVLEVYPKLCLAAGDEMMEAGPFFKRDLFVEICPVVMPELRTWELVG